MKKQSHPALFALVAMVMVTPARAGITGKSLREAAEWATRRFAREAGKETAEQLAGRMTRLAARHGDDLVTAAVRKAGPRAVDIASGAGAQADVALRLLARHGDDALLAAGSSASRSLVAKYGDDAATAILRHGSTGESLVRKFSTAGAKALAVTSPQNGRRLAMLASDGQLAPSLVEVVARYGDRACDFIWKNKQALAVGAVLAAFVAEPEPFLDGTVQLTSILASEVAKPAIERVVAPVVAMPVNAAVAAASHTSWTVFASASIAATLFVVFRWRCMSPRTPIGFTRALIRRCKRQVMSE